MSNLPSGTVTFLFTDIEGSTTLARQFPAELPNLLARHYAILHQAIQTHNGHVELICQPILHYKQGSRIGNVHSPRSL